MYPPTTHAYFSEAQCAVGISVRNEKTCNCYCRLVCQLLLDDYCAFRGVTLKCEKESFSQKTCFRKKESFLQKRQP